MKSLVKKLGQGCQFCQRAMSIVSNFLTPSLFHFDPDRLPNPDQKTLRLFSCMVDDLEIHDELFGRISSRSFLSSSERLALVKRSGRLNDVRRSASLLLHEEIAE